MRTAARTYDFTLPAGGSMHLLVTGEYMRIMESTGAVEVLTDLYRIGPIVAGQGQAKSPFTRLTIIDRSGAGNVGTVLVADSDFIDNRIYGDVSVIDSSVGRTLSGLVFGASPFAQQSAGLFPVTQLYNPAASGRRLLVSGVTIATSGAAAVQVGILLAALGAATDVSATRIGSNYSAGAASIAKTYWAQPAANPLAVSQYNTALSVGSPIKHEPSQGPYVLEPGSGLTIVCASAGADLYTCFEFQEEFL